MCRSYRAKLLYDPSQAYLMVEQLRKAGIRCEEFVFTSSSVGKLATAIMQALRGRTITLPADETLEQELLAVRLRETSPNVMRIDTVGSGGHDDRMIAVAMAVYDLTAHPASTAVQDFIQYVCAPKPESDTSAGPDGHPVGWRWMPQPDRPYTPETAAAAAMLRSLGMRVQ